MAKYETEKGVACTPEEEKLIDSLKRLAVKWRKDGKDLMLFSWSGHLCVSKLSILDFDRFNDSIVAWIDGIKNDGGDPDYKF